MSLILKCHTTLPHCVTIQKSRMKKVMLFLLFSSFVVALTCLLNLLFAEQKVASFRNRSLGTYNTNYVLLLISVLAVLKIPCF